MDWHYIQNGQKTGPVAEEELQRLAQTGVVSSDTLVWRSGLPDWKPFRESGLDTLPPPVPSGDSRACASCGRRFPGSELAMFGASAVCTDCKPAWTQKLRQGMPMAAFGTFHYAGFWIRFGALMIDGLLLGIVVGAVFFFFFGGTFADVIRQSAEAGRTGAPPPDPSVFMGPVMSSMGLFQLFAFALQLGYNTFFLTKFGATPGKMAVGIRVVTPDGGPISVGQAIGRSLGAILSGIILYIGYIMAAFDEEKRALHDRLANTRVIHVR